MHFISVIMKLQHFFLIGLLSCENLTPTIRSTFKERTKGKTSCWFFLLCVHHWKWFVSCLYSEFGVFSKMWNFAWNDGIPPLDLESLIKYVAQPKTQWKTNTTAHIFHGVKDDNCELVAWGKKNTPHSQSQSHCAQDYKMKYNQYQEKH